MTNLVQAKCPHCQNVLRIPADWLAKAMRCKHCQKTFQAKAHSSASASANVQVAVPAPSTKANAPIPVAQPASAMQASPPAAPPKTSSGAPFSFDEEETPSIAKPDRPRRRKRGNGLLLLVLMFFFLFVFGVAVAGVVVFKIMTMPPGENPIVNADGKNPNNTPIPPKNNDKADGDNGKDKTIELPPPSDDKAKKDKKKVPPKDNPSKDTPKKDDIKKKPVFSNDPFPRRALLINVNNYLMFNNVHYGSPQDSFKGGYPGSSTAALRDRLTRPPMNFPATQVYELSDGIPPENKVYKAHSTQKSVLETTIQDFVYSSRAQDRILILFAGHAAHVDGQSYLVPTDGNLKKPESLLPLKWVYEQLAKGKAQQKILILDVFRYSPSRGLELPSPGEGAEGTMPEGFDKDVLSPPAGVQVWCSCQKEQSSIELDGGSAFMQGLCYAPLGLLAASKDVPRPEQMIPVEALIDHANKKLKEVLTAEKRTQVSRLTGKAPDAKVAYDAKEPLAEALTFKPPTVAGGEPAAIAQVDKVLEELRKIPPFRDTRAGDVNLLRAQNLPAFSVKKMDGYKMDDYKSIAELEQRYKKDKEGFAKLFPLRAAYFEAIEALEESRTVKPREVLSKADTDPKKKAAFLREQEPLATSQFKLRQVIKSMKEAGEKRDMETSRRWQANFDYTQARLQSRFIYIYEYNYTLGQIRNDNLPDLAPGQTGWRVGISGPKINVTENEARDVAKKTKTLWANIEKNYPDTPWSLLAQRESKIALGLTWKGKSD